MGERRDEDRRGGPAQVAGDTVRAEGVAQAGAADAAIEDGEIDGMEDRVADAGHHRPRHQPAIVAGQPQQHARHDEAGQAEPQDGTRTRPVHHEAGTGLAHARDRIKHRDQDPQFGEPQSELRRQRREQRRNHQLEEMGTGMGDSYQSNDLPVEPAPGELQPGGGQYLLHVVSCFLHCGLRRESCPCRRPTPIAG